MSLGGAVAAHAVAEGAPCDALALWAPAPAGLRLSADEYRRVQIREALRIARPTLIHLFRDGSPYHVLRSWQTNGIRARIGTWDLFDALDTLGSLGRVGASPGRPPLLLVYAGRDGVLPRGAAEKARAATAGWARFHLVRRASHVSLPIEPETIGLTGAWLATTLASREKPGTP
jgi:pimeloyl-ACP methyl ester carboxylesterase